MKPRLLDFCCKAGGCSVGYAKAGFAVVGVDSEPQPHYPFRFHLGDAIDILDRLISGESVKFGIIDRFFLSDFSAFHASPPCQDSSMAAIQWQYTEYIGKYLMRVINAD